MAEAGFWNDRQKAEATAREARELKDAVEPWEAVRGSSTTSQSFWRSPTATAWTSSRRRWRAW